MSKFTTHQKILADLEAALIESKPSDAKTQLGMLSEALREQPLDIDGQPIFTGETPLQVESAVSIWVTDENKAGSATVGTAKSMALRHVRCAKLIADALEIGTRPEPKRIAELLNPTRALKSSLEDRDRPAVRRQLAVLKEELELAGLSGTVQALQAIDYLEKWIAACSTEPELAKLASAAHIHLDNLLG